MKSGLNEINKQTSSRMAAGRGYMRDWKNEKKKISQSVSQSDVVYALISARNTTCAPCNASLYVRTRCNVNWNYTCVVTRENGWSWESRPSRVMYASCRGSRQGRAVLSLAKWSSSASGYTIPRAILLRATYVDATAARRTPFPRTRPRREIAAWDRISSSVRVARLKERLRSFFYSPHLAVNVVVRL